MDTINDFDNLSALHMYTRERAVAEDEMVPPPPKRRSKELTFQKLRSKAQVEPAAVELIDCTDVDDYDKLEHSFPIHDEAYVTTIHDFDHLDFEQNHMNSHESKVSQRNFNRSTVPAYSTQNSPSSIVKSLKHVADIPSPYSSVFSAFPFFNRMQSECLDSLLHSDDHVVISAPTGSGKTVCFELAIVRCLLTVGAGGLGKLKMVYMAPTKSLIAERRADWEEKFGKRLKVCCEEVTGDTSDDQTFNDIEKANLILTTPEKWDSLTRRWKNKGGIVVTDVQLFMIDEIHVVCDETRGATLEAVVSRMKTVREAAIQLRRRRNNLFRFVAVSATLPNSKDFADWLGGGTSSGCKCMTFDSSYRPVPLRTLVLGYQKRNQSDFKFDISLNYRLGDVIRQHSESKPTLVFVSTRKGTVMAAKALVNQSGNARGVAVSWARELDAKAAAQLRNSVSRLRDRTLRDLCRLGVGFHHAGLEMGDRRLVEWIFTQCALPILITTSTLAVGVNLPAHTVIIKNSQRYGNNGFVEYAEHEIHQMIGRAGRPQFDSHGIAILLTSQDSTCHYEHLLSDQHVVESTFHLNLIEHLNAEIALRTITNVDIAVNWLKSTFLYARLRASPAHYGVTGIGNEKQLSERLIQLCQHNLHLLHETGLISRDSENNHSLLRATEIGSLMARHCVRFETVRSFLSVSEDCGMAELIMLLACASEFSDIPLRTNEKRMLNDLNKHKTAPIVRFPSVGKITTRELKTSTLIQAALSALSIEDFSMREESIKIIRNAERIIHCLAEFLMLRTDSHYSVTVAAVTLAKCVRANMWEDSPFFTRQFDGVGHTMSSIFVRNNITSLESLLALRPLDIEIMLGRHAPFGKKILDMGNELPRFELHVHQEVPYAYNQARFNCTVTLINSDLVQKSISQRGIRNSFVVLVGLVATNNKAAAESSKGRAKSAFKTSKKSSDEKVTIPKALYKRRIYLHSLTDGSWSRTILVDSDVAHDHEWELDVHLINERYVGIDKHERSQITFLKNRKSELKGSKYNETAVSMVAPMPLSSGHQNQPRKATFYQELLNSVNNSDSDSFPLVDVDDDILNQEIDAVIGTMNSQTNKLPKGNIPCGCHCLDKTSCRHYCCKYGKLPPKANRSSNESSPKLSKLPQKKKQKSKLCSLLHEKAASLTSTPMKRLKIQQNVSDFTFKGSSSSLSSHQQQQTPLLTTAQNDCRSEQASLPFRQFAYSSINDNQKSTNKAESHNGIDTIVFDGLW